MAHELDEESAIIFDQLSQITLKRITAADTLPKFAEKTQFNFDQILKHGGGPKGEKGERGERGLPGATGIGKRGPKGERGHRIFFVGETLSEGDFIVNDDHKLGDVVIDNNGTYFKVVEDSNGNLIYTQKFNVITASISSYIISQEDFTNAGDDPVNKWLLRSNSGKETLVAARRIDETSSTDTAEFFRVLFGMEQYPSVRDSTLLMANILPDDTTQAENHNYAQLGLKFRKDANSQVTLNTVWFKYLEEENPDKPGDQRFVYSVDNASVEHIMEHDEENANDSVYHVRSRNFKLIGRSVDIDNITEWINFRVEQDLTTVTAQKDLNIVTADVDGMTKMKTRFSWEEDIITLSDSQTTLDINTTASFIRLTSTDDWISDIDVNITDITGMRDGQFLTIRNDAGFAIQLTQDSNAPDISGNIRFINKSPHTDHKTIWLDYKESIDVYRRGDFVYIIGNSYKNSDDMRYLDADDFGGDLNDFFLPGSYVIPPDEYPDFSNTPPIPPFQAAGEAGMHLKVMSQSIGGYEEGEGLAITQMFFDNREVEDTCDIWYRSLRANVDTPADVSSEPQQPPDSVEVQDGGSEDGALVLTWSNPANTFQGTSIIFDGITYTGSDLLNKWITDRNDFNDDPEFTVEGTHFLFFPGNNKAFVFVTSPGLVPIEWSWCGWKKLATKEELDNVEASLQGQIDDIESSWISFTPSAENATLNINIDSRYKVIGKTMIVKSNATWDFDGQQPDLKFIPPGGFVPSTTGGVLTPNALYLEAFNEAVLTVRPVGGVFDRIQILRIDGSSLVNQAETNIHISFQAVFEIN